MTKAAKKDYPSNTLAERLRARGCRVLTFWQVPGPKGTFIAWMEAMQVTTPENNSDVVIVQTFKGGGWNAFTCSKQLEIEETAQDVIDRVNARERAI